MRAGVLLCLLLLLLAAGCRSPSAGAGGFVRVESSVLDSVRYDPASQDLIVLFDNGDIYEYHGVPEELYQGLLQADSKGRFFHENIRDKYEYEKW